MRKLLLALILALVTGSAQAAFAQVLLPSTLTQYPPPGTLSGVDCLLGVQPTTQPGHPARCFSLSALATFLAGGAGGVGISPGTTNQIPFYASAGQALSPVGTSPVNNAVFITDGSGNPSESAILPVGLTLPDAIVIPQLFTTAGLPPVTAANEGQMAEVTDCKNGAEVSGTGCLARVNNAGVWVLLSNPTTATVTIAGQTINLVNGATVNGAGTGTLIATTDGSGVSGHVPQFSANGTLVDSGSGPGGGGGSGTIAAGTTNQIPFWAANGTTLSPLTIVNSAVLATNGSGVPAEVTTLPANLTIPSATLSNATLSGTSTYTVLTGSGKLNTAASITAGAGLNVPAGVAPTSPVNGDIWETSSAAFLRINGATGGIATTTNGGALSGTSPITLSASGVIACATCAVLPTGGTLTASAPLAISATGAMTVGTAGANEITHAGVYIFDDQTLVHNATFAFIPKFPFASGHVTSVDWITGGTGTPSYTLSINVNGTPVTGCSAITVNTTGGSTTCTSTAITQNQPITFTVSAVAGQPSSSQIQIHWTSTIL